MQAYGDHRCNPQLRELVVEASLALARLDAERLEELALSCQALNRDLAGLGEARRDIKRQAGEASGEMAVFGRVLDATRANLEVMNRLRERGHGSREYPGRLGRGLAGPWALAEKFDGND
jgi:hypothetical protein